MQSSSAIFSELIEILRFCAGDGISFVSSDILNLLALGSNVLDFICVEHFVPCMIELFKSAVQLLDDIRDCERTIADLLSSLVFKSSVTSDSLLIAGAFLEDHWICNLLQDQSQSIRKSENQLKRYLLAGLSRSVENLLTSAIKSISSLFTSNGDKIGEQESVPLTSYFIYFIFYRLFASVCSHNLKVIVNRQLCVEEVVEVRIQCCHFFFLLTVLRRCLAWSDQFTKGSAARSFCNLSSVMGEILLPATSERELFPLAARLAMESDCEGLVSCNFLRILSDFDQVVDQIAKITLSTSQIHLLAVKHFAIRFLSLRWSHVNPEIKEISDLNERDEKILLFVQRELLTGGDYYCECLDVVLFVFNLNSNERIRRLALSIAVTLHRNFVDGCGGPQSYPKHLQEKIEACLTAMNARIGDFKFPAEDIELSQTMDFETVFFTDVSVQLRHKLKPEISSLSVFSPVIGAETEPSGFDHAVLSSFVDSDEVDLSREDDLPFSTSEWIDDAIYRQSVLHPVFPPEVCSI